MTLNHVAVGSSPTVGVFFLLVFFILILILMKKEKTHKSANGSMVRIRRCQRCDPGSIPGWRKVFFFYYYYIIIIYYVIIIYNYTYYFNEKLKERNQRLLKPRWRNG